MKILFQGDSITDHSRDRSNYYDLGHGYAFYSSELIKKHHPNMEFEIINRGISGNQTSDLINRWDEDCINLQPDIFSIMIGINDTWHRAYDKNWLSDEKFEENYRTLLSRVKNETNAKIIVLEEYLLPAPDKYYFHEDVDSKINITRKLAREFADAYIPTDGLLNSMLVDYDYTEICEDGIHPTEKGAKIIAQYYADAFDKLVNA